MPRDLVHAPQLPLFASDPVSSPEALARYEALRPVLTGQRSLRQQSQRTGINYWRLWRDLRRFRRHGLLGGMSADPLYGFERFNLQNRDTDRSLLL